MSPIELTDDRGGKVEGEVPNHTTARKLGPPSKIKYSPQAASQLLRVHKFIDDMTVILFLVYFFYTCFVLLMDICSAVLLTENQP
jgi:hypothetical protein